MSPDLWIKECCDAHDVHTRTHRTVDGRQRISRIRADAALWRCITRRSPVLPRWLGWLSPTAAVYFTFVRLFGRRAWVEGPVKYSQQLLEALRHVRREP